MPNSDFVSMEYEAQEMISEEQYLRIYHDNMGLNYKFVYSENTNIYYDTPDLFLMNHHMVLRIRGVKDKYRELTLKIREEDGVKEINYPLKEDEKITSLGNYPLISDALKEKGVNLLEIKYITNLITKRLEVFKDGYIFVIDKNTYGNNTDYNLEVESTSLELANKYLELELEKYQIEKKKNYLSKSKRAILSVINN